MMYSNSEYADMHLVYGAADGNALEARRRYSELFPRQQLPNHQTFVSVDRRMRQYGIHPGPHSGRPLAHAVHIEEHVLDLVHRDPVISTRQISAALGLPQSTVWRLIRRQQLYPFHLQKVQDLTPAEYPAVSNSASGYDRVRLMIQCSFGRYYSQMRPCLPVGV